MCSEQRFEELKKLIEEKSKVFSDLSVELGDMQDDLQRMCEDLYGHDYGDELFCHNCSKANYNLFGEAEESMMEQQLDSLTIYRDPIRGYIKK